MSLEALFLIIALGVLTAGSLVYGAMVNSLLVSRVFGYVTIGALATMAGVIVFSIVSGV